MIKQSAYGTEPWRLVEKELDLDLLAQSESIFALSNGHPAINVTNGKIIRLLVDDEPFDIRYGTLHSHQRVLDLRAGTLTREVDWSSPAGARIKFTSVRVVSLTQRAIAAIS